MCQQRYQVWVHISYIRLCFAKETRQDLDSVQLPLVFVMLTSRSYSNAESVSSRSLVHQPLSSGSRYGRDESLRSLDLSETHLSTFELTLPPNATARPRCTLHVTYFPASCMIPRSNVAFAERIPAFRSGRIECRVCPGAHGSGCGSWRRSCLRPLKGLFCACLHVNYLATGMMAIYSELASVLRVKWLRTYLVP